MGGICRGFWTRLRLALRAFYYMRAHSGSDHAQPLEQGQYRKLPLREKGPPALHIMISPDLFACGFSRFSEVRQLPDVAWAVAV